MFPFRTSSDPLGADPRTVGEYQDHRPDIERLFDMARRGQIPRDRPLKEWEPATLNERHLLMISARAGGMYQTDIAKAFGVTDGHVSVVMNHPDAVYILTRLQAMRAEDPTGIETRLRRLAEPAVDILEKALNPATEPDELKDALRRTPIAFRALDINGYGAKHREVQRHEHTHRHQLEASPAQMGELARALRESREIEEVETVVLDEAEAQRALGPGGEPPVSPPCELSAPADGGAPSTDGSQRPEATT